MNGRIKNINQDKGFGFIIVDDGRGEHFFHRSGYMGDWNDLVIMVENGQNVKVTFESVNSPKGPRAESVNLAD